VRTGFIFACITGLICLTLGQHDVPAQIGDNRPSSGVFADSSLKDMFESKIKIEWEALKNKDAKPYAELLDDDYEGVEVDGRGERNKVQALSEMANLNIFNYTLWGLKLVPAGPDAVLVIYECTMQFPPHAQTRYSRVYVSELWMKRAGLWKELHYQETRVK
jgi:Domain of unknown function (DUF4440)